MAVKKARTKKKIKPKSKTRVNTKLKAISKEARKKRKETQFGKTAMKRIASHRQAAGARKQARRDSR